MPKPITAVSLREQVYEELSNELICGHFSPGEPLVISKLAESYATSLIPVREAMQALAAEGAIEMLHNKSARIPLTSRRDYEQLIELRMILEGQAAGEAANRLSDEDIAALFASNDGMTRAVAARDRAAILDHNKDLHFLIYERADNPILFRLIRSLWLRVGPLLNASMTGKVDGLGMHYSGLEGHKSVLSAASARDGAALKVAVAEDIRRASLWYLEHYAFD